MGLGRSRNLGVVIYRQIDEGDATCIRTKCIGSVSGADMKIDEISSFLFFVFFPFRMLPPREGRLQALLHLVARDGQRGRRGRLQRRLSKGLLLPLLQLQVSSEKLVTGLVIIALCSVSGRIEFYKQRIHYTFYKISKSS